jgi:hypothetical protein
MLRRRGSGLSSPRRLAVTSSRARKFGRARRAVHEDPWLDPARLHENIIPAILRIGAPA